MKRNKDELVEIVKKFIADRTDDDAISLLEDVSDSFTENDGENEWKTKFDEMSEKYNGMVKKYTDRFGQGTNSNTETKNETSDDTAAFGSEKLEDIFEGGI